MNATQEQLDEAKKLLESNGYRVANPPSLEGARLMLYQMREAYEDSLAQDLSETDQAIFDLIVEKLQ